MKISTSIHSLKKSLYQWQGDAKSIGFVATMGHLHQGHIDLVNQARAQCDKVVVSIFVNPLQFNESTDFKAYPKTLLQDERMLCEAQVDLLFAPDSDIIYPDGMASTSRVVVPGITQELEGRYRPGHFDGVSTVVSKLFNLVQPHKAYFGEKDFQQLLVIKKMVKDLNMPIEIIAVATRREIDGLAMSSRNSRLSAEQRQLAAQLYRTLHCFRQKILQKVSVDAIDEVLNDAVFSDLEQQATLELNGLGFHTEYISICNAINLQKATLATEYIHILAAARIGDVRLIDNLSVIGN